MLAINPISFTANERPRRLSEEKREDLRDTAMAGGAAGAGYTSAKSGGLNMAKKLKNASSAAGETAEGLKNSLKTLKGSKKAAQGLAGEATGLFKSFKINAKNYANNIMNSLKNMKAGKFIQRVLNTAPVKYGCKFFGGILAGCVLLSGLGTLYNNTTKVVDNYAPKLADNFNDLADKYKAMQED